MGAPDQQRCGARASSCQPLEFDTSAKAIRCLECGSEVDPFEVVQDLYGPLQGSDWPAVIDGVLYVYVARYRTPRGYRYGAFAYLAGHRRVTWRTLCRRIGQTDFGLRFHRRVAVFEGNVLVELNPNAEPEWATVLAVRP